MPETRGFGLYVHWPFCLSKCPYCDFNSHVVDAVDHERWREALLRELHTLAPRVSSRRLASIFFGGGTPSLMAPETVAAMIAEARRNWVVDEDCEITLEANPTSVEAGRLARYRDAGVNRISLGVQALDDTALRALGRGHDAAEAMAAIDVARNLFDRLSIDLIYARPGQDLQQWIDELARAVRIAGDHLSLYQLVIEPGTVFQARYNRGEIDMPDGDTAGLLYEHTQGFMADAGMPAYEISNHARPGQECRHNLIYWRSGDYLGVGPGAHSRLGDAGGLRHRLRSHRAPSVWLDRVETCGHALVEDVVIDRDTRLVELLMMGLRLAEGLPTSRLREETGRDVDALFDPALVRDLQEAGYLSPDPDRLRATAAGRQRLDGLLRALLDSVGRAAMAG